METKKDEQLLDPKTGRPILKNMKRLIVISDAEPDDLVALKCILAWAWQFCMQDSDLLVIGCGRDPRDAQHILQCIVNESDFTTLKVVQGAGSKNDKFQNVGKVFPDQKEVTLQNDATQALIDFTKKGESYHIVCLSTWRDLFLAHQSMDWTKCAGVLISGGPDATGQPSFNLRSDVEAMQALLPFWHTQHFEVKLFGPLLYATSNYCNVSCNQDTLPKTTKAVFESDHFKSVAKWVEQWGCPIIGRFAGFCPRHCSSWTAIHTGRCYRGCRLDCTSM